MVRRGNRTLGIFNAVYSSTNSRGSGAYGFDELSPK